MSICLCRWSASRDVSDKLPVAWCTRSNRFSHHCHRLGQSPCCKILHSDTWDVGPRPSDRFEASSTQYRHRDLQNWIQTKIKKRQIQKIERTVKKVWKLLLQRTLFAQWIVSQPWTYVTKEEMVFRNLVNNLDFNGGRVRGGAGKVLYDPWPGIRTGT